MANANTNVAQDNITLETALSIINSLQVVQDYQLESDTQIKCRTRGTIRNTGRAVRIISKEQNIKQIGLIDLNLTTEKLKALAVSYLMQGEFRKAVNTATLSYGVKNTDTFAQTLLKQKQKRDEAIANSPKGTVIRSQNNMVTVLSWRSFEVKDANGQATGEIGYGANELALRDAETASKGEEITLEMLKNMQKETSEVLIETEDGETVDTSSGEIVSKESEEEVGF
jgi:hypothetical protein